MRRIIEKNKRTPIKCSFMRVFANQSYKPDF